MCDIETTLGEEKNDLASQTNHGDSMSLRAGGKKNFCISENKKLHVSHVRRYLDVRRCEILTFRINFINLKKKLFQCIAVIKRRLLWFPDNFIAGDFCL